MIEGLERVEADVRIFTLTPNAYSLEQRGATIKSIRVKDSEGNGFFSIENTRRCQAKNDQKAKYLL